MKEDDSADTRLLPHECRERELTYAAPFTVTFGRCVDEGVPEFIEKKVGCPIKYVSVGPEREALIIR